MKKVNNYFVYKIYSADERGKCPICHKNSELYYMQEQHKYINPITKQQSLTSNKCKVFDIACYNCLKHQQRNY